MREYIIFGKSQNQLINVYNSDTDRKHIQRGNTPMHKHLVHNNLSHNRCEDSQNLNCKNSDQNLNEFFFEFQNRWNKPFKAENCFSVHDTFFRDQNRRTVPYLCKLLTGFNFGLCFIGKKNHELIFFGFCDYEKFAVFIFGYNRRFHIFQFV